MANLADAKKRARQNEKIRERNRARKSRVKTETRKLLDAIHDGKLDQAKATLVSVTKLLDKTAAKGTFHKNTVARRKSRLAKRVNAAAKVGKK